MVNKKIQLIDLLFLIAISIISSGLIYFTWNLLKIQPTDHENTAKKKILIQDDSLSKLKNPSFVAPVKSQAEGRINPFEKY